MLEFAPIHPHASIVFSLGPRNSSQKGTEQRLALPATSKGMRSAGVPAIDADVAVWLYILTADNAVAHLPKNCMY